MDTNNSDLIYSQFLRMDKESRDGKEIIQYFIDIGLCKKLSYLTPDRKDIDWLMKSVKFLRLINEEATDTLLDSVIKAYIAISRMGHMDSRNNKFLNQTTLHRDISKHLWDSKPEHLLSSLQHLFSNFYIFLFIFLQKFYVITKCT